MIAGEIWTRDFTLSKRGKKTRRWVVKQAIKRLWREDKGQDLTEYALLLVLVALVAIATMQTLGNTISNVFANAASNLTSAT
jgi:Flp pilus assembly pilin Flp